MYYLIKPNSWVVAFCFVPILWCLIFHWGLRPSLYSTTLFFGNIQRIIINTGFGFLIQLALAQQKKRALLLVDEAQNLPLESIEELRMLSNFQLAGKPLLQSFLLGQNELNAVIQSPHMEQFRQRIIASSNLSAFAEDDTKAYIQYRLLQAGGDSALLSDDCFALIQRYSRGIPRKINTVMDRILLFGYLEERPTIDVDSVLAVLDEMSQEIANLAPAAPVVTERPPSVSSSSQAILQELTTMLDNELEQKLKMAKELDALLKRQQQLLNNRDSKDSAD